MNSELNEFYYSLEQLLEERPLYCEKTEGLEILNLDEKTQDPYLQALYYKHGIFNPVDLQKAFDLFLAIYDGEINYEGWENMRIPITAFVSNQLSLLHLGYGNVIHANVELSDKYLSESMNLGNRMAIETKASDLFISYNPDNDENGQEMEKIIFMFEKAKILGSKTVFVDLIECYKIAKKYSLMFNAYEKLLIDFNNVTYFEQLSRDYMEIRKIFDYKNFFADILIRCKDSPELRMCIKKHINIFDEEFISGQIAERPTEESLQNLLFIFNNNVLLYKKYIKKLFANFRIVNEVKLSLSNEQNDC